jgi:hypothetical protein
LAWEDEAYGAGAGAAGVGVECRPVPIEGALEVAVVTRRAAGVTSRVGARGDVTLRALTLHTTHLVKQEGR